MITRGRHTVIAALMGDGADMVAAEMAMACAAGVAPFKTADKLSITGNVLWLAHTSDDADQIELRMRCWRVDRASGFQHRFVLTTMEDDYFGEIVKLRPALIVADFTQLSTGYEPGVFGERVDWLRDAQGLADANDCAVLSAVACAATFNARGQRVASVADLGDYADQLYRYDGEGTLHQDRPTRRDIPLIRQRSRTNHLFYHLIEGASAHV